MTSAEAENERLTNELRLARAEAESFRSKSEELEQYNANLANLYVASYQLNATLDRKAVVSAIEEIIVNLIGSEDFSVFELDEGAIRRVTSIAGTTAGAVMSSRMAESVFATGEAWIAPAESAGSEGVAYIPLKLDGRITGLIVIHRLLGHKPALEPLDYELFSLLGTHAATALYCTALQERTLEAVPS